MWPVQASPRGHPAEWVLRLRLQLRDRGPLALVLPPGAVACRRCLRWVGASRAAQGVATLPSTTVVPGLSSLRRPPGSSYFRYAESSMKNSFGLKHLHKFFNIPFLQLQVGLRAGWGRLSSSCAGGPARKCRPPTQMPLRGSGVTPAAVFTSLGWGVTQVYGAVAGVVRVPCPS